MTALTRVRAIALALAFASPAVAQETEPVLRPGDAVRVEVWRQPELSGEFLVAEDGTLLHPLYRGVVVADVALAEARQRLHALPTRYESHTESVIQPLPPAGVRGSVAQPRRHTRAAAN